MCAATPQLVDLFLVIYVLTPLGRDRGSYILISGCLLTIIFIIFISWPCHGAGGILVPQLGMEPMPPAVDVQSPNHWDAREFPVPSYLASIYS